MSSHLKLELLHKTLLNCNFIKYAAYRASSKLRIIQKLLFSKSQCITIFLQIQFILCEVSNIIFTVDKVQLKVIANVFGRHHLQQMENSVTLNKNELESIVSDIYFVLKKEAGFEITNSLFYQLVIDILLSIYDR